MSIIIQLIPLNRFTILNLDQSNQFALISCLSWLSHLLSKFFHANIFNNALYRYV
jgi:hypothetical protein